MLVEVYFNLHKHCWSVRDCKTRKVISHDDKVVLTHAQFKVSEAGRQRVIHTQHKNVHATVKGVWEDRPGQLPPLHALPIRYNPYETQYFEAMGAPVFQADEVWLVDNRKVLAINPR